MKAAALLLLACCSLTAAQHQHHHHSSSTEGGGPPRRGISWCPADSPTPCLRIVGANPVRIRMARVEAAYSDGYEDDGAVCWDPVEGDISLNVIVQGDIVRLDRPGVYKIMYTCNNDAGSAAKPLIRYVRVSLQWDPGCDVLTLGGRMSGLRHSDRMGRYALQYERCEGAEVVGRTTADGPAGRCVQTTMEGHPVYHQVKGNNWLYYYSPKKMWVVDEEFTCAVKCTPLFRIPHSNEGVASKHHMGLRVKSDAHKPEDINSPKMLAAGRRHHTWNMAKLDGRWEPVPSVRIACAAKGDQTTESLPAMDYQVSAKIKLGGVALPFDEEDKREFVVSVADVLDVRQEDVHLGSVREPLGQSTMHSGSRRLVAQARAARALEQRTGDVTVEFTVTESEADLNEAVVPTLRETMFGPILRTELRQQGLKVGAVQVDDVQAPTLTTHAFLRNALLYGAVGAAIIAAGVIAFAIFDLKQKAAAHKDEGDVEVQDIKGEDGNNAAYGSTAGDDTDGGAVEENSSLLE